MNIPKTAQNLRASMPLSFVLIATLAGCGDSENLPIAPAQPAELHGIWERSGYGDTLVIDENGGILYQYTRVGCLLAEYLTNHEVDQRFNNFKLSNDATQLTTHPTDSLAFEHRFERLASLPEVCSGDTLITDATPTATFEHLWHTFNDHYAFFDERGVDWDAQYAQLQPMVNDNMTDTELQAVIAELLTPLDDGHVNLGIGDDTESFADHRGANRVVVENFPLQTEYPTVQAYANALGSTYVQIRNSYLDANSENTVAGTGVRWGTIGGRVGFLRIGRMSELSGTGNDAAANLKAIQEIMPIAMAELQNSEAMIIDVRLNGGGEDVVSLEIARYFNEQRRLAMTKFARSHAGDTMPIEAYIEPAVGTPYLNPIAVLSAPDTASAAEIFLIAMNALPQVTLVGENSYGILSEILSKTLPNDWEVSLSNEVYTDTLGLNHEVSGVAPQVFAPTFSIEAMDANRDAAIDAALQTLGYSDLSRRQ